MRRRIENPNSGQLYSGHNFIRAIINPVNNKFINMNNENKSLMSPDRVLSLVVLMLSIFMILSVASLSYVQEKMDRSSARIISSSSLFVEQIQAVRQQVKSTEEEEGSEVVEE